MTPQIPCHVPAKLSSYIVEAYVDIRERDKLKSEKSGGRGTITARQLQAILRLAQARARLHFRQEVEIGDVNEAIRLVNMSKASVDEPVGGSGEGGRGDFKSRVYNMMTKMMKDNKGSGGYLGCPDGARLLPLAFCDPTRMHLTVIVTTPVRTLLPRSPVQRPPQRSHPARIHGRPIQHGHRGVPEPQHLADQPELDSANPHRQRGSCASVSSNCRSRTCRVITVAIRLLSAARECSLSCALFVAPAW